MEQLTTMVGLAGVALVLVAYILLASGRVAASGYRYQLLNVIGTVGILLSLTGQWNLPAFVANASWLAIGIFALLRMRIKGHV